MIYTVIMNDKETIKSRTFTVRIDDDIYMKMKIKNLKNPSFNIQKFVNDALFKAWEKLPKRGK